MIREHLETTVVVTGSHFVFELIYVKEENRVEIWLNGKPICQADWNGYLDEFFERAIELWSEPKNQG